VSEWPTGREMGDEADEGARARRRRRASRLQGTVGPALVALVGFVPVLPGSGPVLSGSGPVLSGFGPAPAVAQVPSGVEWATIDQQVEVDMSAGDGSADIVVRYRLGAGEEGAPLPSARPVTFELLGFGDATAREITLLPSGATTGRVFLWPTVGSHRVAVIEPPRDADGETLTLTASYRVEDVIEGRAGDGVGGTQGAAAGRPGELIHARIPVLTGPPVRAASGGDAFEARLRVPEEWAVTEGFPSGLRRVGDGAWAVSLTVAPSVIGFRASTDGRWRPGVPLLIDVVTMLILASFLVAGWRHLRRMAA
jgi:hypothetical protein